MKYYEWVKKGIIKFNYMTAILGALVIVFTMLMMTADVTARVFKWPLEGAVELAEVGMALLVFLGWTYTQEQKRHIAIDILFVNFPARFQRIINVFNTLIGLIFMSILAWLAYKFTIYSKVSTEVTENLDIPVWPFKLSLFVGAVMFCLQLIFDLVDEIQSCKER